MNTEQAKLILQSHRIGGEDADDPQFAEALEQLKADPELARWFAEERELDRAVQAKLRQAAAPPPHLKDAILTSYKVVRPPHWWNRRSWVSAAAAAVITLGIAAFWLASHRDPMTDFRNQMVRFLSDRADPLEFTTPDIERVRAWLTEKHGHGDFVIPRGLTGRPSMGCRVLAWKEHAVSFVCFELDNREMVHLFVIDRQNPAGRAEPLFNKVGELNTALWDDGDKTYLIAGRLPAAKLRRLP